MMIPTVLGLPESVAVRSHLLSLSGQVTLSQGLPGNTDFTLTKVDSTP